MQIETKITPEQAHAALNMLDQNCSNLNGSRRDHEALMKAATLLKTFIVQNSPAKPKPEPVPVEKGGNA